VVKKLIEEAKKVESFFYSEWSKECELKGEEVNVREFHLDLLERVQDLDAF
jgi:hypothetical protein